MGTRLYQVVRRRVEVGVSELGGSEWRDGAAPHLQGFQGPELGWSKVIVADGELHADGRRADVRVRGEGGAEDEEVRPAPRLPVLLVPDVAGAQFLGKRDWEMQM